MKKVGLVGWRGMVGSVLMQRMVEEGDFAHIDPVYFSTSAAGGKAPVFGGKEVGIGFSGTYDDAGAQGEATALAGKISIRFKAKLRLLIAD